MTHTTEQWDAATLIGEWSGDEYRYKLLSVPRATIDEESSDPDAYLLLGIDSAGIRRVDILLDDACGRSIDAFDKERVSEALAALPAEYEEEREIMGVFV